MKNQNLITKPWADYEVLDSGNDRKLERWGNHVLIRPETQAIWEPRRPELWRDAHAEFRFANAKGVWENKGVPETWDLAWREARFRPGSARSSISVFFRSRRRTGNGFRVGSRI